MWIVKQKIENKRNLFLKNIYTKNWNMFCYLQNHIELFTFGILHFIKKRSIFIVLH